MMDAYNAKQCMTIGNNLDLDPTAEINMTL